MVRKFVAEDYFANDFKISVESSVGLYPLFIIIISVLMVTMVLFACGDDGAKDQNKKSAGIQGGGGAGCGGGCGGC
ncbi:hypothetical protein Lalb_Chr03g0029961 [Lupinus albus]|uniref:Transmembrane protein n=1 Tax=Lupinus albus TaxID=3870 RepID=A0A6A4QVK8_LUPAL|nr:hypothetical protein Lalb_Chr03g0029961 [Lupinus albus]